MRTLRRSSIAAVIAGALLLAGGVGPSQADTYTIHNGVVGYPASAAVVAAQNSHCNSDVMSATNGTDGYFIATGPYMQRGYIVLTKTAYGPIGGFTNQQALMDSSCNVTAVSFQVLTATSVKVNLRPGTVWIAVTAQNAAEFQFTVS